MIQITKTMKIVRVNEVILVLSLLTIKCAFGWKPIVGTSHIHHPISTLDVNNVASSSDSVTYHGNAFLTSDDSAKEPLVIFDSSDSTDDHESRVLSGISSDYGTKILGGLISPSDGFNDQCSVEKYALENEGTIQYDVSVPPLDQFTLCAWFRFTSHKGDHSIFTYSVEGEPREIQFWIANAKEASYFSLAVHGQSLFRLNYPLKLRKWHHACASWNGKTGEWQLWVKAERVGRGFYNRIVGYQIKGNGFAYSGGPSITGPVASGLHMEITILQLYKVALSAGKAHRDHKHHHVHQFNHDGLISTTTTPAPPPAMTPTTIVGNTILANGQIVNRFTPNLAGIQQQMQEARDQPLLQTTLGQTLFVNGQINGAQRLLAQQLAGVPPLQQTVITPQLQQSAIRPQLPQFQSTSTLVFPQSSSPSSASYVHLSDPANAQYIDETDIESASHAIFKRNENTQKRLKSKRLIKNEVDRKHNSKRALVELDDGFIVNSYKDIDSTIFDGLSQFSALDGTGKHTDIEDEIRQHDQEAAEGEVSSVLELCSSCAIEPFQRAVVLAWKDAKIHIDNALKGRSQGPCGQF